MASVIAAGTTAGTALNFSGDTSGALVLQTNGTTTAVTLDTSQNATFAGKVTSAGALTLASNGTTTAVTIDTSQNVGIGTASPAVKLDTNVASGNIEFRQSVGGVTRGQFISSATDQYIVSGGTGSQLFYVNSTERMRIDSSGNLFVGATAFPSTGVASFGIESASTYKSMQIGKTYSGTISALAMYHAGTTVGTVTYSNTAAAYNTSSDYRLKDTITPMTGALAKVSQLKPVTYKWKSDSSEGQGFIAHELAEVVPDCVTGEKDAVDDEGKPKYQGIDTSFLVATLTAAIQEAHALIIQLQADVAALKGVK